MKIIVIIAVVLAFLAIPAPSQASCWECVADQCRELGFWLSGNYQFGYSACSQRSFCPPAGGGCVTECRAFGSSCTYWDVWF